MNNTIRCILKKLIILGFAVVLSFFSTELYGQNTSDTTRHQVFEDINIRIQVFEDMLADMEKTPSENEAMAKLLYQLGGLYFAKEDFSKAVDCYVRSLAIREFDFNNFQSFGIKHPWILVDIGNSLFRLAEYDYALSIYLHGLRLFNMRSDQRGIITSINNIGLCHLHMDNPKDAIGMFSTALNLSTKINDSACVFISGVYKGMAYNDLGKYRQAIDLFKQTRKLSLNNVDYELRGYLLIKLAEAYKNIGQKDSAFQIYNYILADKSGDAQMEFYKNEAMVYSADIYFENEEYRKAEDYYLEALAQLQYLPNMLQESNVCQKLYLLYKKNQLYEKALFYYEEYQRLKNKIGNEKIISDIIGYNQKIDHAKSNWKIREAEIKENIALKEKDSQKKLSIFLIASALMLIIVMISSKGFETRITYLKDYFSSFETGHRILWLLSLLIYFTAFYYFFTPINSSKIDIEGNFTTRIIPGASAFIICVILFYFAFRRKTLEHLSKTRIKNHFFIVFTLAISLVFLFESLYYLNKDSLGLNTLLSLFLLIFTSFILPFYFGILLVEKYIMKQVENIARSMDREISIIKESSKPSAEEITINSEKTSATLTFQLGDLLMVEAQGNYCMFYICKNGNCENKIIHITMKSVLENLSKHKQIIRCHKSYIANLHHVVRVSGSSRGYALHFENHDFSAAVSRGYQKDVMNSIRQFTDGIL